MTTTLSVNNFATVNITFSNTPTGMLRNINNVALFTTDTPAVGSADATNGYAEYVDSASVKAVYGSTSITYKQAQVAFKQKLNLKQGRGKLIIIPLDGTETIDVAVQRAETAGYPYFNGIVTNKVVTDDEVYDIATLLDERKLYIFDHNFNDRSKNDVDGLIQTLKDNGSKYVRIGIDPSYTSQNDSLLSAIARASTLRAGDFTGGFLNIQDSLRVAKVNQALTIHGKELVGLTDEDTGILQSDIERSKITGAPLLQTFGTVGKRLFTSGANSFVDDVYHEIFLKIYMEDQLSLAIVNSRKIGQVDSDIKILLDVVNNVCELCKIVGIMSRGGKDWTSEVPSAFRDEEIFKTQIKNKGSYAEIPSVNDQPLAERQARKAPKPVFACVLTGAVHSIDVEGIIQAS
jgi:hypothetical protein